MAMIDCPECGKKVSNRAKTCPHCGVATGLWEGFCADTGKIVILFFGLPLLGCLLVILIGVVTGILSR